MTGPMLAYSDPAYAASLRKFGTPRALPASGGWLLERAISGINDRDAMGCYPLFSAPRWDGLADDLRTLAPELVSLVLVTDPFGDVRAPELAAVPGVQLTPWKEHFVIDMQQPLATLGDQGQRRNARLAARSLQIEVADDPTQYVDDWVQLYSNLSARFGLTGLRAMSPTALAEQLQLSGAQLIVARQEGIVIAAHLYLQRDDVAYLHLVGVTDEAYRLQAAAGLTSCAVEFFSTRAQWLSLGGGAGVTASDDDGLSVFKRRWATHTRPTWLLSAVLNAQRYEQLSANVSTDYFPAYRANELATG
ncbi:MAG: GNAT family N-acetyltransferase [Actinobacteria bacterium]|nr:GNAT family N-acetyltransferase [Actinomycetota bacterium]